MISEERLEKAITYLAHTDEEAAKAKALKEQLAALEASQEESQLDGEVVFEDLEGDSDVELDEELVQFEFPTGSGNYYYRSSDDFVTAEEDGPAIGQWDEEDQIVVFDDED